MDQPIIDPIGRIIEKSIDIIMKYERRKHELEK